MSVGCSKIRISVIVKQVEHIRIVRTFYLPGGFLNFSVPGGTEKFGGLWLGVISTQADTMIVPRKKQCMNLVLSKVTLVLSFMILSNI